MADKEKIDLPEDIFGASSAKKGNAGQQREPEREEYIKLDFVTPLRNSYVFVRDFFIKYDWSAGVAISLLVHVLLILFIGSISVFNSSPQAREISVEVMELDHRIESIPPEVRPPEKSEEAMESEKFVLEDVLAPPELNHEKTLSENLFIDNVEIGVEVASIDTGRISLGETALCSSPFFSSRSGARRKEALKKYGGSDKTEKAVEKALAYLASKQNEDGSWGSVGSHDGSRVVLSSLALLSFLAHGESTSSVKYGKTVGRAVRKLVSFAKMDNIENCADGFGHAILAYALAEAYGITRIPSVGRAMNERIKAIAEGQNKFGSFNYNYDNSPQDAVKNAATGELKREIIPGEPRCDLSFAGWNYQAMAASSFSGADVKELEKALKKAGEALKVVHQAKDGGFSYGFNARRFEAAPEMTPVGALCLQLLGAEDNAASKRAFKWLEKYRNGRMLECRWEDNQSFPLYTWYYQTQALFHGFKGRGNIWKQWNESMKNTLLKKQSADGSWLSPASSGKEKSRGENLELFNNPADLSVYCTSFCALMLEVYYRYLPTFVPVNVAERKSLFNQEIPGPSIISSYEIKSDSEKLEAEIKYVKSFDAVKFGKFNGQPLKASESHLKNEFGVYGSDQLTIRVKGIKDFPQQLKSQQRIAIYLDDFLPENFRNHIVMKCVVNCDVKASEEEPKLHILLNNKSLLKSKLRINNNFISVLLPVNALLDGGNILQIRNDGTSDLCFDFLEIDEFNIGAPVLLAIEDLDKLPPVERKFFNSGIINLPCPGGPRLDNGQREKMPDYKHASKLQAPSDVKLPFGERRRNLDILKKRFKTVAEKNPAYHNALVNLYKKIQRYFRIGAEPVINVTGPNTALFEAASAACGDFVYLWAFTGIHDKNFELYKKILKKHSPVSECGSENLCDIVSYEEYKEPVPELYRKTVADRPVDFNASYWGMWPEKEDASGLYFQKLYVAREPRFISEWLQRGGEKILLTNTIDGGKFFDKLTGKPKLAWEGLKRVEPLFQGSPLKLDCNIVPSSPLQYFNDVFCTAVMNCEGVVTIQANTRFPGVYQAEINCPVPWNGKTKVKITTGLAAPDTAYKDIEKIKIKEENVEVKNNIFSTKLLLPRLATIRLVKDGTGEPSKPEDQLYWEIHKASDTDIKTLTAEFKRPANTLVRTALRSAGGCMNPEGENYSGQTVAATKDRIGKAEEIVPWESESSMIEIRYPNGKAETNEGIKLPCGGGPKNAEFLSFWVFPRTGGKDKNKVVELKFAYNGNVFRSYLKSGMWQRITLPFKDGITAPYWKHIRFITDSRRREYKDGATVSFEFNGFAVWGKEHKEFGKSGIEQVRILKRGNTLSFILLGVPGRYGEYRYYFDDEVEFPASGVTIDNKRKVSFSAPIIKRRKNGRPSPIKKLLREKSGYVKASYRKASRILEFKCRFPLSSETDEKIKSLLSAHERFLIEKKYLTPIIISTQFQPVQKSLASRQK